MTAADAAATELVIPAQAGIQSIKKFPAQRINIKALLVSRPFYFAGFPPARE
jgi:hypothetical protein